MAGAGGRGAMDSASVVPTEDTIDALMNYLVAPLLPLRVSLQEAPTFDQQEAVARQQEENITNSVTKLLSSYQNQKEEEEEEEEDGRKRKRRELSFFLRWSEEEEEERGARGGLRFLRWSEEEEEGGARLGFDVGGRERGRRRSEN